MAEAGGSRRRTLPFDAYSNPAVLRAEQERIFRRHWQYVGHTGLVNEAGSMAASRAGDVPVLLVRDTDGRLRAFVNVCRHRGALLVDGSATRSTIQCPYHAWTYGLDGCLKAAPRSANEPDFDPADHGLLPLAVDRWGPFIFVNSDPGASPLSETMEDLPDRVADTGIDVDSLRFLHRSEGSYEANWKVCCENYLECYHCQVAHPGFCEILDVSEEAYTLQESRWFSSQYGPLRKNSSAAGGDSGPYDARGEVERGQFHFVFPNLTINVAPGRPNLSLGPVIPDGPERTVRFLDYFVAPDADEEWIRDLIAWDDQVGAEDRALVARVQRGVRSGMLEGGTLFRSERLIGHFDRLVREALGG